MYSTIFEKWKVFQFFGGSMDTSVAYFRWYVAFLVSNGIQERSTARTSIRERSWARTCGQDRSTAINYIQEGSRARNCIQGWSRS